MNLEDDKTLKNIRGLVEQYVEQYYARDYLEEDQTELVLLTEELVGLVQCLDEWLCKWGFTPQEWWVKQIESKKGPSSPSFSGELRKHGPKKPT